MKEMKTEDQINAEVERQRQLLNALTESEHGEGCMSESEFRSIEELRIKTDAKIDALHWVLP